MWSAVYEKGIVRNKGRNELIAKIAKQAPKPSIIFVENILQKVNLIKLCVKEGVIVIGVDGKDDHYTRQRKVDDLRSGDTEVLVSTTVFQEGVDVPELRCVIIAAGKSSTVAAIQRRGRGTRPSTGKDSFELYDIFDTGQHWLEKHSNIRREAYEDEGDRVTLLEAEYLEK